MDTAKGRARGAQRGAPVVEDILNATVDELARVGYRALRVEDVAARAGVHKTTIYRRYPTKKELVQATLECAFDDEGALVDTGSVRGDLTLLAGHMIEFLQSGEGRALVRLLMTEGKDEDLRRIVEQLRIGREQVTRQVIDRAIARGEIDPKLDGDLLVGTMAGSLHHTIFYLGQTPGDEHVEALVDLVLHGVLKRSR